MKRKLPLQYPIFDSERSSEFPCEQYYIVLFDKLPSIYSEAIVFDSNIIDCIKEMGFIEDAQTYRKYSKSLTTEALFVNAEMEIIIKIWGRNRDELDVDTYGLVIYYNKKNGFITSQIDLDQFKTFEVKRKKSNIHLVKNENGYLDTEEFELKIPETNISMNYGDEFLDIHKIIVNRLNKQKDNGIILLHGEPGTGKTSYIRFLTSLIETKKVLFIPPAMATMLSEPSIIPFLMENKDSILIIEDAEKVISDREFNGSSAGVSNILNLTDGILADCLSIQIVATFNMKREKIDGALLRKGRLIAEHKFEKLTIPDTNRLFRHLGLNVVSKEAMCLTDIYNYSEEVFRSSNVNEKKIGFLN
jgi:hypothetical protein